MHTAHLYESPELRFSSGFHLVEPQRSATKQQTIDMSSADTTAAKKAAGQLQQDQADLHGSHDLKKSGHTTFQHGKGMEDAHKDTGAAG